MFRAALFLLLTGAACAQSTPTIHDYMVTPAVIEAASGDGIICGHYAQRPGAGQVQVWCRIGGVTVVNAVFTVGVSLGFVCSAISPSFNLAWALIPDVLPAIKFQIAAQTQITGPPLFFAAPIVSSPGVAALGGSF